MNAPSQLSGAADVTETLFLLPRDVKCLKVAELTARLRDRIGPVAPGQTVITRPGFRLIPRLVPEPLAALVEEFRQPSLITDAILRFGREHGEDPAVILEQAFDALATLIQGRILVPAESAAADSIAPSLGAGQAFACYEIDFLVRAQDDSEIYKARDAAGEAVALKIGRADRPEMRAVLQYEARVLESLGGEVSPRFHGCGMDGGRPYVAMEYCEGTSIATAAQQARAAGDRDALHHLVGSLFVAYARLHGAGVLHGDVHTGNCMVREDKSIVILDFGAAIRIGEGAAASRGGIPHFHDPDMAGAMLRGRMPPPATPASEQYALCVLAYLLLTGLHPMQSIAVQDELLRQIVRRPPLPFAARGVAAWPKAEAVLARGLAKRSERRFASVAALAAAWRAISLPKAADPRPALDAALAPLRDTAASALPPLDRAWLALRAALALGDGELLAAAEMWIGKAEGGWAAQAVAAQIARAQSDHRAEQRAIAAFIAAAGAVRAGERRPATLAAAEVLDGIGGRPVDASALVTWATVQVARNEVGVADANATIGLRAALALGRARALPYPEDLGRRLGRAAADGRGDPWLWADAHFALGTARFRRLALAAPRPETRTGAAFAALRLHQLTGSPRWIAAARGALLAPAEGADLFDALLAVELKAPERAVLPAFLLPRVLGGSA
ncbi:serine/threonine protein kinase [Sphingomonas parva]|nr:AarF/UbiB family protein [Sphingomonas parva]